MKCDGQITWVDRSSGAYAHGDVTDYVLDADGLRIDVTTETNQPHRYVVRLPVEPLGSFATGTWRHAGKSGTCGARVFRYAGDIFVVLGEWTEDGNLFDWWAEIEETPP